MNRWEGMTLQGHFCCLGKPAPTSLVLGTLKAWKPKEGENTTQLSPKDADF